MPSARAPSELEMQVLSLLWERGPLSVRQVQEALPDGRKRAYTTVLSVLQVMEKKGLLKHSREGMAHLYRPAVQQREIMRPMFRNLLRNVFGGKPSLAVQCLIKDADVSADELQAIRQIIDQAQSHKK